jgi:hypothetical protein
MEHSEARILIANVERDLQKREALVATDSTDLTELRTAWGALVKFLGVPPAAELRACPHCGGEMMKEATLCKFCWGK